MNGISKTSHAQYKSADEEDSHRDGRDAEPEEENSRAARVDVSRGLSLSPHVSISYRVPFSVGHTELSLYVLLMEDATL